MACTGTPLVHASLVLRAAVAAAILEKWWATEWASSCFDVALQQVTQLFAQYLQHSVMTIGRTETLGSTNRLQQQQ